jgi:4a-hydroxytetrahydrobiopterin dehydratase
MSKLVLTNKAIKDALENSLEHWELVENKLHASFKLANFHESLVLIQKIGSISKKLDHHAEICNLYDLVTLSVWSHDVNGITERDLDFAKRTTGAYQAIVGRDRVYQSQTETNLA